MSGIQIKALTFRSFSNMSNLLRNNMMDVFWKKQVAVILIIKLKTRFLQWLRVKPQSMAVSEPSQITPSSTSSGSCYHPQRESDHTWRNNTLTFQMIGQNYSRPNEHSLLHITCKTPEKFHTNQNSSNQTPTPQHYQTHKVQFNCLSKCLWGHNSTKPTSKWP